MSGTITLLIILLATLSTAFLSSIFGMLGGLILMGALITIMPVSQAMVLHGLIQLTSNGYRAWLNKTDIKWNIVSTLIIGNTISLVGLFSLAFVPDKITVLLVLGLLPYIAWALPKNNSLDVSKKPIGILAGMVVVGSNLLSGTGGPLLDIFFQRVNMTRHQVVATKAVAQSLGHISKVIFFVLLVFFCLFLPRTDNPNRTPLTRSNEMGQILNRNRTGQCDRNPQLHLDQELFL